MKGVTQECWEEVEGAITSGEICEAQTGCIWQSHQEGSQTPEPNLLNKSLWGWTLAMVFLKAP